MSLAGLLLPACSRESSVRQTNMDGQNQIPLMRTAPREMRMKRWTKQ